jgi:hypothetical protein
MLCRVERIDVGLACALLVACGAPVAPASAPRRAPPSIVTGTPYARLFDVGRMWSFPLERQRGTWPEHEGDKPEIELATHERLVCRTTKVTPIGAALAVRFDCTPEDVAPRWWPSAWIATSLGLFPSSDLFPSACSLAELVADRVWMAPHPVVRHAQKDFDEAGWTVDVTRAGAGWCFYELAGAELDRSDIEMCFEAERGLVGGGGLFVDGREGTFKAFHFGDAPPINDL